MTNAPVGMHKSLPFQFGGHAIVLSVLGFLSVSSLWQLLLSENNLASSFYIFCFAYFSFLAGYIWFRHQYSQIDILEPIYGFIVLYSAYSLSAVGNIVVYDNGSQLAEILPTYYFSVIVGLVSVIAGYNYINRRRKVPFLGNSSGNVSVDTRKVFWSMALLLVMVSLVDYTLILRLFDYRNVASYTDRIGALTERTVSSSLFNVLGDLLFRVVIFMVLFRALTRKKMIVARAFLVGLLILPSIMSGSKSVLIFYFLFLSIFYHYHVKRIRPEYLVLLVLMCYPFIVMISHVRNTTRLSEMFSRSVEYINEDASILSPFRSGELIVPQNFMNIISDIQKGNLDFTYGASWISEILVFIPRAIFPNRPLSLPEFYANYYSPTEYSEGKGFGSYILMDGYYAFGAIGIMLLMSAYGALLAWVYRFYMHNANVGIVSYVYAIFYMEMVMNVVRTGVFLSLKSAIISLIPFFVIFYISRSKIRAV